MWIEAKDGFERLIIQFPDGSEDTALLKVSFPGVEGGECSFEGTLKGEEGATVVLNGCPKATTFDVMYI